MKKRYLAPELDLVKLTLAASICESSPSDGPGEDPLKNLGKDDGSNVGDDVN